MKTKNIAFLISGGGTTMMSVLEACRDGELRGLYSPSCVIASRKLAGGLDKARNYGLDEADLHVVPKGQTAAEQASFGQRLINVLTHYDLQVVAQLGWLPFTPTEVIHTCKSRGVVMLNQHPGPLDPGYPDFGGSGGMHGRAVHAAVLGYTRLRDQAGPVYTEVSVQYVDPQVDRGAVIHRRQLQILPDDDPYSLQARLLPLEHRAVIEALLLLAQDEVRPLERDRRLIDNSHVPLLELAKRFACATFPKG